MQLGLGLPHYSRDATPARLVAFAQRAETLGYGSLWALERLLRPLEPHSLPRKGTYPTSPDAHIFDPIETLTYIAAHTRAIRLGTSAVDVLFHIPVVLARRLSTLDHFSGGRLLAGLGQGWSADDFEAACVPVRSRGDDLAGFIEALQADWGPDPVSSQGHCHRTPAVEVGPKPLQRGGIPILVSVVPRSDALVERAGRMGLGLHPVIHDWKTLEHQLVLFREAAPVGGRPGPVVVRVTAPVTEAPLADAGRGPLSGSVGQVAADLHRAAELGVDHVVWDLTAARVPYEVQLRLLEPLIAARPE
ncbi:LLM class flavin-dependent oxidoreductase [Streptomyces sp. NPDC001544]|uniref:LLM class flavin-dependent oxidoreductase n=1 Tax=Streptomyces sp. NPDC001544 TaxID=3364584 RepID=UPI003695A819